VRVLVACEFSGVVREAFRTAGHDAWSCDLMAAMDGSMYHKQDSIWHVLGKDSFWDLVIAHPPCTYLAVSGARWWKDKRQQQEESIEFFMAFTALDCKVAIENPIGLMSSRYRKPDQIIQPWMFGHGETKATCLWLKGLPLLKPTDVVEGRQPRVHHESPGIKNGLTRQQRRSITLPGIAKAMAEQWGKEPGR
jgi:hypothetical protein